MGAFTNRQIYTPDRERFVVHTIRIFRARTERQHVAQQPAASLFRQASQMAQMNIDHKLK